MERRWIVGNSDLVTDRAAFVRHHKRDFSTTWFPGTTQPAHAIQVLLGTEWRIEKGVCYITGIIIHQIFSLAHDWSKRVTWPNIPQQKLDYPRIFPNFQNCARCERDLKDNEENSLHFGRKYTRIFVLGYNLFLVAHSFPRASLSENCSLLGTDNVRGQISEHIFAPNGDYCLCIRSNQSLRQIFLTQVKLTLSILAL